MTFRARTRATSQRGFTLLELLVAIVVFGVMSVMAYQGLVAVVTTDEVLSQEAEEMRSLRLAVELLTRDLRQSVPRGVRGAYGDPLPALSGNATAISLTRAGWSNPTGQHRAELERVSYQLDERQLLRQSWPVLDRTPGSTPRVATLLENLELVGFRYLDDQREWHGQWPPANWVDEGDGEPWPRAVSVSLRADRFGQIERIVALALPARPVLREPDAIEGEGDE